MRAICQKNIVLFIDGTWNKASDKNLTNVRKLFDRAYALSGAEQVVHYISGVGTNQETYASLPFWVKRAGVRQESGNVFSSFMRKYAGGAFGYGMPAKVTEAYAFLVAHYNPGDRIFIFGFSRGAYAVRSLTCFIEEVGLLLKDHLSQVERAYRLYESGDKKGMKELSGLVNKLTGSTRAGVDGKDVLPVHMMGVWDTVGALGFTKHHSRFRADEAVIEVPKNIYHVRHALALHELRPQFEPLFWKKSVSAPQSSLQQVWFPGAHADVGGGYYKAGLSDIALEWMATEAKKLGLSVRTNSTNLQESIAKTEVSNSISYLFAGVTPRLRDFITEHKTKIYDKELDGHAVHRSAALRVRENEMPKYGFLIPGVNRLLREVDKVTVNLIWALAIKNGQLPLDTLKCDEVGNSSGERLLTIVVPERLKNWSNFGASVDETPVQGGRRIAPRETAAEEFAAYILACIALKSDVELEFVKEELNLLCSKFKEIHSSSIPESSDARLADNIYSVIKGVNLAAHLAPTWRTRRMLFAMSEVIEISCSTRPNGSSICPDVKKRVLKA